MFRFPLFGIQVLILVASNLPSFQRDFSIYSGAFQFLLLCFVISALPSHQHFLDGLV